MKQFCKSDADKLSLDIYTLPLAKHMYPIWRRKSGVDANAVTIRTHGSCSLEEVGAETFPWIIRLCSVPNGTCTGSGARKSKDSPTSQAVLRILCVQSQTGHASAQDQENHLVSSKTLPLYIPWWTDPTKSTILPIWAVFIAIQIA